MQSTAVDHTPTSRQQQVRMTSTNTSASRPQQVVYRSQNYANIMSTARPNDVQNTSASRRQHVVNRSQQYANITSTTRAYRVNNTSTARPQNAVNQSTINTQTSPHRHVGITPTTRQRHVRITFNNTSTTRPYHTQDNH